MKVEDMNALAAMRSDQLRVKAAEVGVPKLRRDQAVTDDELRLLIIRAIVEAMPEDLSTATVMAKVGGEHLAEAIQVHAHGSELAREVLARRREAGEPMAAIDARLHLDVARSASAVALAALAGGFGDAIGEAMQIMGRSI